MNVTGLLVQNCSALSAVSLLLNTLTNAVKCFMITIFQYFGGTRHVHKFLATII